MKESDIVNRLVRKAQDDVDAVGKGEEPTSFNMMALFMEALETGDPGFGPEWYVFTEAGVPYEEVKTFIQNLPESYKIGKHIAIYYDAINRGTEPGLEDWESLKEFLLNNLEEAFEE